MERSRAWYAGEATLVQGGRGLAIDCAIDEHQNLVSAGGDEWLPGRRSWRGAWRATGPGALEAGAATLRLPDGRGLGVLVSVEVRSTAHGTATFGTLIAAGRVPTQEAA